MKKLGMITLFLSIVLLFLPTQVLAAESTNDFSVSMTATDHQISGTSGYYNLKLEANQTDRLPVTIKNNGTEAATFEINFQRATTNSNGIVDYTIADSQLVGTAAIDINDLVTVEKAEITVPAGAEETVYVDVKMSEKTFDGVLLGGIQVSKKETTTSKAMVSNRYQYVIALQISQNEKKVTPKLTADKVSLVQDNAANGVTMQLENKSAVLLSKLTGTFVVRAKGSKENIIKETKDNLSIAPNSSFKLQTLLGEKFAAGEYTYTITLKNADENWRFSKDFTVTAKQAENYNQTSVDEEEATPVWVYGMIALSILVVILILLIIFLLRRKNKS